MRSRAAAASVSTSASFTCGGIQYLSHCSALNVSIIHHPVEQLAAAADLQSTSEMITLRRSCVHQHFTPISPANRHVPINVNLLRIKTEPIQNRNSLPDEALIWRTNAIRFRRRAQMRQIRACSPTPHGWAYNFVQLSRVLCVNIRASK